MVKRIKKTPVNYTMEQAEEASKTVAEKKTRLDKIQAKMNEEVNKVKDRYSDEITKLKEQLKSSTDLLEIFAKEQRASWGDKKSFALIHCIIAFRTNSPKVSKQNQFTWEEVLKLMKKSKTFKPFIRVKEEINKEAILALNPGVEKDNQILNKLNNECFVFIDRSSESFFVTPKEEVLVN